MAINDLSGITMLGPVAWVVISMSDAGIDIPRTTQAHL